MVQFSRSTIFVTWVQHVIDTVAEVGPVCDSSLGEGNSMFSMFGDIGSAVCSAIGEAVVWLIKQFLKIPLTVKLIGTAIAAAFDYSIEYVSVFGQNVGIIAMWMIKNWRQILTDMYNVTKTIFTNLWENIKELFTKLWDWVKSGFTGGLEMNWKKPLEGFKSAIAEMPELVKAQDLGYGDVFNKILDEADAADKKLENKWGEAWKKTTKQTIEEAGQSMNELIGQNGPEAIGNVKGEKKGKEASFTGLVDVWKNAQKALMGGDVQEKQLAVQKEQLQVQKDNLEIAKKAADKKPSLSLA